VKPDVGSLSVAIRSQDATFQSYQRLSRPAIEPSIVLAMPQRDFHIVDPAQTEKTRGLMLLHDIEVKVGRFEPSETAGLAAQIAGRALRIARTKSDRRVALSCSMNDSPTG
jgi:hypothetical protein